MAGPIPYPLQAYWLQGLDWVFSALLTPRSAVVIYAEIDGSASWREEEMWKPILLPLFFAPSFAGRPSNSLFDRHALHPDPTCPGHAGPVAQDRHLWPHASPADGVNSRRFIISSASALPQLELAIEDFGGRSSARFPRSFGTCWWASSTLVPQQKDPGLEDSDFDICLVHAPDSPFLRKEHVILNPDI